MNIPAWTLLVVLNGGQVTHNEGFTSLKVCQDARQLVLTGRTVEKEALYQAEEKERQAAQKAAEEKYAKDHRCKSTAYTLCIGGNILSVGSGIWTPLPVAECVPETGKTHEDALSPVFDR